MDLSKRYIHMVTNNLPENQREEVARELTSSIEDMARDKSNGKKPTQTHIREVLIELGNPLEVARQYRGNKDYLISPTFYYYYIQTLKRILVFSLPVFSLVYAITYKYSLSFDVGNFIVNYGLGLATVTLHVLFWITGVFVLLEKTGATVDKFNAQEGEWSVDSLPPIPTEPQIRRTDTIASMSFYAGLIVGSVVLWQLFTKGGVIASIFSNELTSLWMPVLIGICVLALLIESAKLIAARWNPGLLIASLFINIMMVAYVGALALTQTILKSGIAESTHTIALWAIYVTVVVVVCSYLVETFNTIKQYRTKHSH